MAKQYSLKAVLSVTDKISPALKKVDQGIGKIGRSFGGLSNVSKSLASGLAAPLASLTALAGVGGFSFGGIISQFTELGGTINDASKKAGVTVEELQKLQYAAQHGGISAEGMTKALGKLTSTMGGALSGKNKDAAAMFKHLGISLKDADGNIRSSADVMRNLAEAVKNNVNPTARLRILTTMFGDELAKQMIPMLAGGAAGLDEMTKQAEKLGLVIGQETADKASHLGDVLGDFSLVVKSLYTRIAAQLAPIIENITQRFQDWIVANKDLIAQRLETVFDGIQKAVEKVDFTAVLDGIMGFVNLIAKAVEAVGGIGNVIKAFGLLIGASMLGDLLNLGKALYSVGAAFAAAFGPWGIVAAAAVAAGVAIYENWDTIKAKLFEVWDWITKKYEAFKEALSSPIKAIKETLSGPIEAAKAAVSSPVEALKGLFGGPKAVPAYAPAVASAAPALAGMGGVVPSAQESRMTGDVSVRIITDKGARAEVEDVTASGGKVSAEPVQYSYTDF